MTVSTTNITSGPYTGNDVTTAFAYDFRIEEDSQLTVYETDLLGVITELTLTTDYTVSDAGEDAGGEVTRVAGALPAGYTWYIRSNYPETQLTNFSSQGGFFPSVHEAAFDKLVFINQQQSDLISRKIGYTASYSGSASTELPAPIANNFLKFNSDASGITSSSAAGVDLSSPGAIGDTTPATGAFTTVTVASILEAVTGDGVTIDGVLLKDGNVSSDVISETTADTGVTVDGVLLKDGAVTLNGVLSSSGNQIQGSKGADVASASALPLLTDGNTFDCTGTATITSFNSVGVGTVITLVHTGIQTLTHHATDLICLTEANITTAVGDVSVWIEYASGDYRMLDYTRADGTALSSAGGSKVFLSTVTASSDATIDIVLPSGYGDYELHLSNWEPASSSSAIIRTSSDGGSTFDTGGTDYRYSLTYLGLNTSSGGWDRIILNGANVTAGVNGLSAVITISKPSEAVYTQISWYGGYPSGATSTSQVNGSGYRKSAADVDAVRLLFSSGNISSGTATLYGIKES